MPVGVCGAPNKFQETMHMVLCELILDIVIVALDDINDLEETFDETLKFGQCLARFWKS